MPNEENSSSEESSEEASSSDEEVPKPVAETPETEQSPNSPPSTFPSLGICSWLQEQLSGLGISSPTPVQAACVPPILAGRDCVGVAKTGEGKTLAFALPILQTLSVDPYGIFALVLTPTRELANQIGDTFRSVGKPMGLRDVVVTGGRDTIKQSQDLDRRPHVVIATPGRLADHIENNSTFSLAKVRFLVLDEADRLLEGGFDEQLATILSTIPSSRQTLLFTATSSSSVTNVINSCKNNPFTWSSPTLSSYNLHDIEATSFIPYLVQKIGDPKDQIRASCKSILKLMCKLYPASKLFTYVMTGIGTKNAKQRTECLDELGCLIAGYGTGVAGAKPSDALKEMAKQIADRDNSVRNAALNAITETYFQEGEKLYKMIGNLPEKDMAMLEERIKRASKTRQVVNHNPPPAAAEPPPPEPRQQAGNRNTARPGTGIRPPSAASAGAARDNESEVKMRYQQARSNSAGRAPNPARPVSGAFSLDLDKIEGRVGMERRTA